MTRSNAPTVAAWALAAAVAAFGFACAAQDGAFFVLKRFSSIPPVVRRVEFFADCTAAIYVPPAGSRPFTFRLTPGECDTLQRLCSRSNAFDTLYYDSAVRIPNPSSIILEFTRGGATKKVTITALSKKDSLVARVLECAAAIERRGLRLKGEE